jgi:hypothetical protein
MLRKRKLEFKIETVRTLSSDALKRVVGGIGPLANTTSQEGVIRCNTASELVTNCDACPTAAFSCECNLNYTSYCDGSAAYMNCA